LGISEQIGVLEVQCASPPACGNTMALTNPIPSYGPNSKLKTDALDQDSDFLVPNHGAMQFIAILANAKKRKIEMNLLSNLS
jgi:hypothetical protein